MVCARWNWIVLEGSKLVTDVVCFLDERLYLSAESYILCDDPFEVQDFGHLRELGVFMKIFSAPAVLATFISFHSFSILHMPFSGCCGGLASFLLPHVFIVIIYHPILTNICTCMKATLTTVYPFGILYVILKFFAVYFTMFWRYIGNLRKVINFIV